MSEPTRARWRTTFQVNALTVIAMVPAYGQVIAVPVVSAAGRLQ